MEWWKPKKLSKRDSSKLKHYLLHFVVMCPSSTRRELCEKGKDRRIAKRKITYSPVSNQNCSFKRRNVTKDLLKTLLAQIRHLFVVPGSFAKVKVNVKAGRTVENEVKSLMDSSSAGDDYFDLFVYAERSDMPDTEAVFYYIRNSFAHGSFGVRTHGRKRVWYLECKKDDKVNALARLSETTLERLIDLMGLSLEEIVALRVRPKR